MVSFFKLVNFLFLVFLLLSFNSEIKSMNIGSKINSKGIRENTNDLELKPEVVYQFSTQNEYSMTSNVYGMQNTIVLEDF